MRMKLIIKTLLIILTAVVITLAAVQWLLQRRLTPLIQEALPDISREAGLELRIEGASINLLAGAAAISGLTGRLPDRNDDPPVLSVDRANVSIGWFSLFREILCIRNLSVDNARLVITRQPDGTLRLPGGGLQPPGKQPDSEEPPAPDVAEPATATPSETPFSMPRVALQKAAFSVAFVYDDQTRGGDNPSTVAIDLSVIAEDLFTYGDLPPSEWGVVKLTSVSSTHPGAFAADLEFRVAPLPDPSAASMTVEGRILGVKLREFGDLTDATGITGDSADITVQLNILEGSFQKGSMINVSLRNPELTGELREKNKRITLPGSVTLAIPIRGTLSAPTVNIPQAVTHSLLKTIADNPDAILDQVTIDGKSIRDRLRKSRKD